MKTLSLTPAQFSVLLASLEWIEAHGECELFEADPKARPVFDRVLAKLRGALDALSPPAIKPAGLGR